jgi:hypothetical protein
MVSTQAQAPQLQPAERRMEQAKFLFELFGIDVDSLNHFLSVQIMNPGTPMQSDLFGIIPDIQTDTHVQKEAQIAYALIHDPDFGRERVKGGVESFCNSDEDFYALVGTVLAAHSTATFGTVSDSTAQWLFGLKVERDENGEIARREEDGALDISWDVAGSRVASTLLQDIRGKKDWLMNNYEQFSSAAIFYVWAMQNGFDADFVNKAGTAAFGELWLPAATVGQFLESVPSEYDPTKSTWILHGRDRAKGWDRDTVGLAMDALRQLGPLSTAPTTFAEEAQPEQERTQLDEFRSRFQRGTLSISDTLDRVLTESRGWAANYSQLFSNYNMQQVEEGAVFYAWAKKNGMGEDEINALGSAHYKDDWAFASLLGKHLSPRRPGSNEYVLPTDEAKTFQADLDSFRLSQSVVRVAETGETAEATGLAAIAQSVGVTEDYLRDAVQLMVVRGAERVKIAYDRSDVGEEGTKPVTRDPNGYYVLLFHRPEGSETAYTDSQLTDAVNKAADVIHPGSRQA